MFDLTHDVKLTANFGKLIPVCNVECMPGDKMDIQNETLIRLAPLVAPVLHRFDAFIHYYFVPNRILWPDFYKWLMQGDDLLVHPYLQISTTNGTSQLLQYMGLPDLTLTDATYNINALPVAAYQAIWNDYYRDQNLIDEIDYKLTSGSNQSRYGTLYSQLRYRAWEHDYFTSCLPFAQKGDAVVVPFDDAPVMVNRTPTGTPPQNLGWNGTETPGGAAGLTGALMGLSDNPNIPTDVLYAEMSGSSGTINNLRRAYALQRWLETNARGGTRNVEAILAHFDVKSKDSRLQRPEYICGSKTPIQISEVLNTTGEDGGLPQGNMSGHGIAAVNGRMGSYYCQEHGWIIGVMSILPRTAYSQGIHRSWSKSSPVDDYPWPEFANIGEQPVLNKEIFANVVPADGEETFGYNPRYAEYKYMNSRCAGDFAAFGSLEFWHCARTFENLPTLSQEFIECGTDIDDPLYRIFAVTDPSEDHFFIHHLNKIRAVRKLPKYGIPQ